ncbi:MAG: IreB family regulatory phosphoprotein [Oscillospiraceae bacterium]|nr:IreB family regulatory phosphoprotein [Oscillospiraceae bacterium]
MSEHTVAFSLESEREIDIKRILQVVYHALEEKGYNPINQLVGFILSEDPTYITTHNHARSHISKIDRDELLQVIVKSYINQL